MQNESANFPFLDAPQSAGEIGRLGPYCITGLLGKGGMSYVFAATDQRLKRVVALKVMNQRISSTPRSRKRFLEEARAMAAIQHDNVATIFEVGQHGDTPFMAMEILKGRSLAAAKTAESYSTSEVIRIAREICRGLSAAHAAGIIHRDIKPANIWLAEDNGRVKLLDFGLAIEGSRSDQIGGTGNVTGTPGYLAPEQARNEPVDDRTDLYSVGVVLYELLTKRLPLASKNVAEQMIWIIARKPAPVCAFVADIPRPLGDLVDQLLSKEPRDRPTSALALERNLAEVARQCESETNGAMQIVTESVARPASSARQTPTPTTNVAPPRHWIVALSVVAVLCGCGIVWWAFESSQTESLTPTNSTQSLTAVTAASLKPLQIATATSVSPVVPAGEPARFRIGLVNNASTHDDPRSVHADQKVIARINTFLKRKNQERFPADVFPTKFSAIQLPTAGTLKNVEISIPTASLPLGAYTLDFELQSPAGDLVASAPAALMITENFDSGELVGFQTIRIRAGAGKDGFVRENNNTNLSNQKTIQILNGGKQKPAHAYLQFDLSAAHFDRTKIDRAVLLLTIAEGSSRGASTIKAYAVQAMSPWTESGDKSPLTWNNSPSLSDIPSLTYLGQTTPDNQGGRLEKQPDTVRIHGPELDNFVRSAKSDQVTLLLVSENKSNKPTKFYSHEGSTQYAAALALRQRNE